MARTRQKTAFVFAGGGRLGAIQVGMRGVLLAAGLQPDFVIGTSVGAINASDFAGAPNVEGVARLAKIWSDLRRSDVFPLTSPAHSLCSGVQTISSTPAVYAV